MLQLKGNTHHTAITGKAYTRHSQVRTRTRKYLLYGICTENSQVTTYSMYRILEWTPPILLPCRLVWHEHPLLNVLLYRNLSLGIDKLHAWWIFHTTRLEQLTFLICNVGSSTRCQKWWMLFFPALFISEVTKTIEISLDAEQRNFGVLKRRR